MKKKERKEESGSEVVTGRGMRERERERERLRE